MPIFDMGLVYNDFIKRISGVRSLHKILSISFSIMKYWLIGFIIILPVALSLCMAAKRGDKGNTFVNSKHDEQ